MNKLPKRFLRYFKKNENKEFHFLFALVLVFVTIPLPKYSLNSQAIILLILAWLGLNPLSKKFKRLLRNKWGFLLLSTPFWLHLIGALYSDTNEDVLKEILKQIPFLILPLIFTSIDSGFIQRKKTLNFFPKAVFVASLFAVLKASYFYLNNLDNYFYYNQFSLFLNKHTTYFSLFIVISIVVLINDIFKNKKHITSIMMLVFFIVVLYFLSVRISIIAIGLVIIVTSLSSLRGILKYAIILLIPLVLLATFNSPNFKKRFEPSQTEVGSIEDIDFRKLHWQSVLETISEKPIFGVGTEGNRETLFSKYKEKKLTAAYEENYNAHNQFLEVALDFGVIGLIIFLGFIGYLFYLALVHKDFMLIQFLLIFIIYFLTESLLVRHSGIIMFSLLISLLFSNNKFLGVK
jgi:O-antigen ligase